ncbi:hypothetical protein ABPG72_006250 [Tetrahymena utriculariae]
MCQEGFYFQIDESQSSDSIGSCLSICNPFYKGDTEQNICKKTLGCSSQFATQQNFNGTQQSKGLFVYQEEFYVSLSNGYVSLFDRANVQLIKHLNYQQDDLNVQYLSGIVYALSISNQVQLWNIITENRVNIFNSAQFIINSSTQLFLIQNKFLIIQFEINESISLQAIYNQQSNVPILSNFIQINLNRSQIIQQSEIIIKTDNQIFSISLLSYSSQNNSLLQSSIITCDGSQQGNLISVLQTTSPNRYFSIHQNGILDLNSQSGSCTQIYNHQGIQKAKVIQQSSDNSSDTIHLIILASQSLIDYNLNTLSSQQISDGNKKIFDFEVGSFLNDNNEIISLTDLQNLELYSLQSLNQQFSLQYSLNSISINAKQLIKIQTNYTYSLQNESQQSFEVIFLSNEIQIVRKNSIIANELELKIIDNFVFPFPTPNSPINSMILVDNAPLILTCHVNGDIIFYDTSRGIDTKLIRRLQNLDDECFQIAKLSNNQAVAQMRNQILLINPLTHQVAKAQQNLNLLKFVSVNQDKISAVYDDCLIILSHELSQLFNQCNNKLLNQANSLYLDIDLKIVIQTDQQINIIQVNLTSQQLILLNQQNFNNKITYFNCIYISQQVNNYHVDEIVIFDSSRTFHIYSSSLLLIHQVYNINLISVNQAKRVINDNTVYMLIGLSNTVKPVVRMHAITKNQTFSYENVNTFISSPLIDDPVKIVNANGSVFYHAKQILQLNFFTIHEEYQMDLDRNLIYTYGIGVVYGAKQITQVKAKRGATDNFIDYVGTEQGLLASLKYQQLRYNIIDTHNILSENDSTDQIQDIIQSTNLFMYFVKTSNQITSFNLFTNEFVEELQPLLKSDATFSSFREIVSINSVVCWNEHQILLSRYGGINKKFYFQGMNQINGWVFDEAINHFYVFGNELVKLDTQLNMIAQVTNKQQNYQFIQCLNSQKLLICSNSFTEIVLFDKGQSQISQKIKVDGFTQQIQISIDEANQNIYLFNTKLQVFSLQGIQQQTQPLNMGTIQTCEFHVNYAIFFSPKYIILLDRISLSVYQSIQAPQGLNMVKYLFVEILNQIIFSCDNPLFSQIYIWSISTNTQVGQISGAFGWNKIGETIDMVFIENSTILLYLDDVGNLWVYEFYNEYRLVTNFKITEIADRNEVLIGFKYNSEYNNIFVYSKSSIYQINYGISGVSYQLSMNEPSKLFAMIPISQQEIQYVILNNNKDAFRYQNFSMIFENSFNQDLIDVTYDENQDVIIYGLTNSIVITKQYKQSIQNKSNKILLTANQIQFFCFLQNNIFLTFDKKIVHCDLQTATIINTIQLDDSLLVTSFASSTDKQILLVGMSNGQLLQYNLADLTQQYYTAISQNSSANTQIIKIIFDETDVQNYKVVCLTNGGIMSIVNLNNKQLIQNINLVSLVNEEDLINLQDFIYDNTYLLDTFSSFLDRREPMSGIFKQTLKIALQCYLTTKEISQDKQSLIQLHRTIIKKNIFYDRIIDYQIINASQIIILFSNRYEIFMILDGNSLLISQQYYTYPRFLGYFFTKQTNFLKIYGLHQTGVFENDISLDMYQNNIITECQVLVNSTNLLQTKQQVTSIIPKQSISFSFQGQVLVNQANWQQTIFLLEPENQFSTLNKFLSSQSLQNTEVVISPQVENSNNLYLDSNSFLDISQVHLYLNNFNFIFKENQNKNDPLIIGLNNIIQNVMWQQVSLKSQNINCTQITFQNIEKVIINELNLIQLQINFQNNQQCSSLFQFVNVSSIQIQNLNINHNVFSTKSQSYLFEFFQVENLTLINVQITQNRNINSVFKFSLVSNLNIKKVIISQNNLQNRFLQKNTQQQSQNAIDFAVFQLFGCTNSNLFNFIIENNHDIPILYTNSSYKQKKQVIFLTNNVFTFQNITSSLNSISDSPLFKIKSSFVQIQLLNYTSNLGGFMVDSSNQVVIGKSKFTKNSAQNDGAIYFKDIVTSIQVNQSQVYQNAAIGSGGGFYIENIGSCMINFDSQSTITNNKALIGGGLRIVSTNNQPLNLPINFPFSNNVYQNQGSIFGNDCTTYLQNLKVENYDNPQQKTDYYFQYYDNQHFIPQNYSQFYSQFVNISNFQSGGFLVLRIHVVDNYNRYLNFSKQDLLNGLYPYDIQQELKNIQIFIDSLNSVQTQLLGEKILNYNQYNTASQSYELTGLQLQGVLQTQQLFSLSSSIYTQSQVQNPILLQLEFRKCLKGEIIQQQVQNISVCKYCQEGSYQLMDPQILLEKSINYKQSQIKNECSSCPSSANNCSGFTIQIKNGYWRSSNQSDEILPCDHLVNSCQPENPNNINGCIEGYIGPLCGQCDIIGEIWQNGRYTHQLQIGVCDACSSMQLQYFYLVLKVLYVLIYLLFTLKLFNDQFIYTQTCYYLRKMGVLPISNSAIDDYSGFFLKIIVNYLQLSSQLIPQPQKLSINFNFIGNYFGQLNKSMGLGIDCMIDPNTLKSKGKIVIDALIQSLIPFIVIGLIYVGFFIIQKASKKYIKKHYYSTFFYICYTYFQLDQISYFANSLTCRQIGSQVYNPNDMTQLCNNQYTNIFIYPYSLVVLFIWSILPLLVLRKLYKKKYNLNDCLTKYYLGYFYGEMKSKFYYWEFIRMYVKIAIISIQILLSKSNQLFSFALVMMLLAIYIKIVLLYKPFISQGIIKSEVIAYSLIIFKIILTSMIQEKTFIQTIVEAFILLTDYMFLASLLLVVLLIKSKSRGYFAKHSITAVKKRGSHLKRSSKIINLDTQERIENTTSNMLFKSPKSNFQRYQQDLLSAPLSKSEAIKDIRSPVCEEVDFILESISEREIEEQDPEKVKQYNFKTTFQNKQIFQSEIMSKKENKNEINIFE